MRTRRISAVVLSAVLLLALHGLAKAAEPTEIRGAAILDHPCGKVAVKHMGLVHAGKMEEATKLGNQDMQDAWKALPAEQREMISKGMTAMSKSEAEFSADIKANGLLVIDGTKGTLTITKKHNEPNDTSTETMTQRYTLDGDVCRISRKG
jgi:TRAP-type C4-dicarboxylate transport system substrate-binding protein